MCSQHATRIAEGRAVLKGAVMLILVRKYAIVGTLSGDVTRIVARNLVPLLNKVRGLKEYHIVDFGEGHTGSVSSFADASAVENANEAAFGWVLKNLPNTPKLVGSKVWETIYDAQVFVGVGRFGRRSKPNARPQMSSI